MRLNEKKRTRKKQITYSIVTVFFILIIFTPFYSYLYNFLEKPFISAYSNTEEMKNISKNIFHSWFSKKRIIDENNELKKKIAILEVDVLRTKYLESLLEKSNVLNNLNSEIISTSILHKNNSGVVTILGGKDSGFSVGDSVFYYDGTLIGNISSVFDKTSRVSLFIKNGMISNGILFPQNISITTTGNGNAMFAKLNRDIDISVGDVLYNEKLPGYIMGTVSNIDFDPRDPMKKVFISPIHSIRSLQQIGIKKTTLK